VPVHRTAALSLALLAASAAWAEEIPAVQVQVQPQAASAVDAPAAAPSEATPSPAPFVDAGVALPEATEAEAPGPVSDGGILYTADLSDQELARRFLEDPASLGTVSFGLAEAGRVLNAVPFPKGEAWTVVDDSRAYGTQELVDALTGAAAAVQAAFPGARLRVCHVSAKEGGWLLPHQSHQSGRDVDLGFYYRAGVNPGAPTRPREQELDPAQNWALLKALVTQADVQFILVDQRIQRVLYAHALQAGEPKAWLDKLFLGPDTLVRHAWRHRDHFHVRFYAPRSQELGRRLQPLLSARPEENVAMVRVQPGDTLGALALRHRSTVALIQRANGLGGSQLVVGRTLKVPVRGPCTTCPVAPAVVVPPRLLRPDDSSS
jgi:murein endopeptidase